MMRAKENLQNGIEKTRNCAAFVLRLRYVIAAVVFVLLVAFKISGSNIGYWANYIDTAGTRAEVWGESLGIRSDEWQVLLPVYFAQKNSETPFSIVNPNITVSGQNVVITLDAPVRDIYTITKPTHWGFFFLDSERAVAWYWDLKLLLILLLSYELCMILTRGSRLISVLGSVWLAFSPAVQWWFAQHVGDNVLYFEAMVVTFYYFLRYFARRPLQILFGFLFCLSCLGFLMPLYPPIQVPFGFLALLLFALIFLDFRKKLRFRLPDWILLGVFVLFTLGMTAHLYGIIKDAIAPMSNTVYPGKRVSTGGGMPVGSLFYYLTNPFLPYRDLMKTAVSAMNSCEISAFFNFLPALLLALPVWVRSLHARAEGRLRYGIALTAFSLFFGLFMISVNVPQIVMKFTLLSYVTGARALIPYTFAGALASIWALAEFSRMGGLNRVWAAAVSAACAVCYLLAVHLTILHGIYTFKQYLMIIVVFTLLSYLLLRGRRRTFAVLMVALALVSGVSVNPISQGSGGLLDNAVSTEIRAVDKSDPQAVWMGVADDENLSCMYSVLVYLNGATATGGINNYPDMAKWSLLDPTGKYAGIYNRSAHVSFHLVKSATSFRLVAKNSFAVDLNPTDLKKLRVDYIVSNNDLTAMDDDSVNFTALYGKDKKGCTVYKVTYR